MIKFILFAAAALMTVEGSATIIIVPLGVIVVPPTQTSSIGTMFLTSGANSAYYEFTVSQPNTTGVSSFTNSAVGGAGVFNFSSIGLYSGLGTGGTLRQAGTITPRVGGTTQAYI